MLSSSNTVEAPPDDPAACRLRATSDPHGAGLAVARQIFTVLGLVFLATPFHSARGSDGPAGPSANALFQFQKDNRSHPWLHITADSGMVERRVLRIDRVGLHEMSTPEGVRLPGSLPWSRIARIDEVVTRAGPWRKVGAVTLGLLGAGLGNAINPDQGGISSLAGLITFGAAGGYLGGRYGSRFRSERHWYVADTVRRAEPQVAAEDPAPGSAPGADPAVLRACNRIGRSELFRAYGTFGTFRGYASIAGPEGLEELRTERSGKHRVADDTLPQRITWGQVDRVEIRGGSALRGAMVGGATFATAGALLAMAVVAVSDNPNVSVPGAAVVGALCVAPVGMALGGLGGAAFRRWVPVYQRH
jgi:hypothetical protein